MDIKELKEIIKDLPEDMLVQLLDISTDEPGNHYGLEKSDFDVDDMIDEEGGEIIGKCLWICFKNYMNDNPI